MGRAGGVTGGKDGNMHFGDRELGCVGMVSMLPDMALVATGMALAFKMRGEPRVAMTFFGEGSTANGQWHEAMNFAGIHRLPVVFVLENNQFAYSTPNELEFAVDPVERAAGLRVRRRERRRQRRRGGVRGRAHGGRSGARRRTGPTLIECQTMRMHGHGAHDDMSYVPTELLRGVGAARPDRALRRAARRRHGFSCRRGRGDPVRGARPTSTSAPQKALASPMPEPELAIDGVFAEAFEPLGDGHAPWSQVVARPQRQRRRRRSPGRQHERPSPRRSTGARPRCREMTYLEAISDGLREEMRRDETVFCIGEDIGAFGGAFKVTDGFIEEFGADRVLDTPLAENAIIGTAVGAAVEGLRPVCEMQFADFIACGFDQLVNVAAKLHYRQGVAVPMVVRLPSGGGFSGGPFHSQNPEAWFLQAPGPEGRGAGDGRGRQGPAGQRDPGSEPGLLPRAQGPLPPRQGRGAGGRVRRPARQGADRARGRRDDA